MKKVYSKPDILFEDFSVSTNIASNCEKTPPAAYMECGFEFPGIGVVFLDSIASICNGFRVPADKTGGDGDFNGLCYHVTAETQNLFNS